MNVELPRGWALATIPDLIGPYDVFSDGDWVESEDQDPDGDVRLIQLADVGDGIYIDKSHRFLTSAKARELRCTFLEAGDLLIARMPDPLGRSCIFPGDQKHAVTVVDVCVVRSGQDEFDHRWLMHFINSPKMRADIHALQSGSTRKRISRGNLGTISIPVPPRSEQVRIVEKLEELLSDLDAGVAELKAAQRKLAQYRQSLLKAAMEGALTADWRASQGTPKETGAELLQRILKERCARWEQKQLAKFEEQGKAPPKGWQATYSEPVVPDLKDLPPLPAGWAWASVDQVAADTLIGLDRGQEYQSTTGRVGYIKMNNVSMNGEVETERISRIDAANEEVRRYEIVEKDLLLNTRNSKELVGKVGLVRSVGGPTVYNNNLMRIRLDGAATPDFACYQLCGPEFRERMEKIKKATTSVAAVYAKDFFPLAFKLPPADEQHEIVRRMDAAFLGVTQQQAAIEFLLKQAAAQRKNLLKAAFSGQLVPQDPNDEPASVLLARIRAGRESGAPINARKRGRKTKEKT